MGGQGGWYDVVNAGWFGSLLGVVSLVIGAILSIWLYHRGKPINRLRAVIVDTALIVPQPNLASQLTVLFAGIPAPRVTSTTIGLWNDGTTIIRGSDIVAGDPLRLQAAADAEILQASLVATSRAVLAADVHHDGSSARIGFDYLDPGDGFRIQVLHTGKQGTMSLAGTVRGLPKGVLPGNPPPSFIQVFGVGLLFMSVSILLVLLMLALRAMIRAGTNGIVVGVSIAACVILLFAIARWLDRRPNRPRRIGGIPAAITDDDQMYAKLTYTPEG